MAKHSGILTDRISPKDFKFAQLILNGVEQGEAAKQCGYSTKGNNARIAAYRLLNKPTIKTYIDNERSRLAEIRRRETEVDDIWITLKFKAILDRCMQSQAVMRYDRESKQMVHARDEDTGELLYVFDSAGAIKAAENLAKHIGYYEVDNRQKKTVIQIGCTQQNIMNFFEGDEQSEMNIGDAAHDASDGPGY